MSFLEYNVKSTPTGWRKILYLNWALALLLTSVASVGFLMLYSVAGGSFQPWAEAQIQRFILGFAVMLIVAMVPIWFWRNMSVLAYIVGIILLLWVEFFGVSGGGAQRWIDLGFMRLQPSEVAKITVVMMLAAYYDWLDLGKVSHPLYVAIPLLIIGLPVGLTFIQPDLGTSMLILMGGGSVMFMAGMHWLYFVSVIGLGVGAVSAVFASRGTSWQLLADYQYGRIDTFLDPSSDPLGDGYHITQSQIALGSGGWTGRGFMQGTQIQGDFLPESHTDFIFPTLAEEFGFVGGASLLLLYVLILVFCIVTALMARDRYASLMVIGVAVTFFLYFALNMAMVMGLAPVVGVPLPLVSYGGSAMLVLMAAFGLVQSAHVHRAR
ncbi:rod shape-determining protein RodA [Gymnodinialimonas ceratoperidinii]|uniref:Peptidoglycan glycosyltransferase MrdB n=1 Tax=Gymnodinialimonas ceratoperidinii TaxID=2856823 RepID=A0A8F6TYY1_9RHOB|nr:rod shape-determining protein RodA [Gymnodinialimonas ceratoperidinii]QXT40544.1 rod shape-determining protein RodA [Gymnodinialimonas ceratoperidinii]